MRYFASFLTLFLSLSCTSDETSRLEKIPDYPDIDSLEWLVGNWSNISENEASFENWTRLNDSTLAAHSYTLVGEDTVFAERMTVRQSALETNLSVIAYRQNDGMPVSFRLASLDEKVASFENPDHDFPTRINYSNPSPDSIHAWIEGSIEGEEKKVDFFFTRH